MARVSTENFDSRKPDESPPEGMDKALAPKKARLQVLGITKTFPGVRALDGVDLATYSDEILGLIGENGAGKSTLFDILTGIHSPNSGEILIDGRPIHPRGTYHAMQLGIFRVFQEQGIIGGLTVAENLCLGMEEKFVSYGVLQKKQMGRHARDVLSRLGLSIDVNQITRHLSFGMRQLIEVARVAAMSKLLKISSPIILLDEPTSALSRNERDLFFNLLKDLRATFKASIVFVSHRLEEIMSVSDRIYVLKDGAVVAEVEPDIEESELHRLMVGRSRSADFYCENQQMEHVGSTLLSVHGLSGEKFHEVTLEVRASEIVGVGGLVASGKTELGKAIYGAIASTGDIRLGDTLVKGGLADRIKTGIGYIPLDRHMEGILLGCSIVENTTLIALPRLSPRGILRHRRELAMAEGIVTDLRIKSTSVKQSCRFLSGGNQQKTVIGKWMIPDIRVLIADNPTRGVDAGAKEEIYQLIRDIAAKGVGILLITDDLLELIGLSNRILVMKDGRVTGEVPAPIEAKPAEHEIVSLML